MKFGYGRTLPDGSDSLGRGAVWSQVFPFISKCPLPPPLPLNILFTPLQLRKRGCFLKGTRRVPGHQAPQGGIRVLPPGFDIAFWCRRLHQSGLAGLGTP